jgi:hypothetical protein
MQKIGDSTATANDVGEFSEGNPAAGVEPTWLTAAWHNTIQRELIAVVMGAGFSLDPIKDDQVLTAILSLLQSESGRYAQDTGVANSYVATYAPAITKLTDGMILKFKAKTANSGASTFSPNGLPAAPIVGGAHAGLQGGEIAAAGEVWLQWNTSVSGGCWVLMSNSGAARPIAPAISSQHAIQFGQVSGVVGQARNLKASVTSPSASALWVADEIILENTLGGLRYCLPNFNKTINLSNTGAGGMDVGSAPLSGHVAIYAGYNPLTGAATLFGSSAVNAIATEVYSGSSMPAGYNASALLGVVPTNSSGQFAPFHQIGRRVYLPTISVLTTTIQTTTPIPFSIAGAVPKNAKTWRGQLQVTSNASASTISGSFTGSLSSIGGSGINTNNTAVNGGLNSPVTDIPIITPQTAYYSGIATAGTMTLTGGVTSYEF